MTREEAIEIYKGLINPNIIEAFEVLVPELKEIGYDRMREQIIRGFENWKGNGNLTFNNLCVDDILAWFEKQKEQKPVPISCGHENGSPAEVCYGPKGDPDPAGVWKPSEEQMTNLLRAEGRLRIEGEGVLASKLAEIYEQLKKLL